MQLELKRACLQEAIFKAELCQLVHFTRDDIRGDGDDALAAKSHDGGGGAVVAAPDGEARRAEVEGVLNEVEVVARLLDTGNVRMLGKRLIGLRRAADACAGGNVVEDDRNVDRVRNGGEMLHKTALRGLVVVRRDGEQRIDARALRGFGERNGGRGAVRAAARDDGHAAVDGAHAALNERHALIVAQRRGLAGCAADDDGVGAALNLALDETVEGFEIDTVAAKRCDDSDGAAGEDAGFHKGLLSMTLDRQNGRGERRPKRDTVLLESRGKLSYNVKYDSYGYVQSGAERSLLQNWLWRIL